MEKDIAYPMTDLAMQQFIHKRVKIVIILGNADSDIEIGVHS